MTRRKWYVVTVGKGIGVFPTWIEAAPLVKGVPEAIYQSFPTEGEARRLFAQEMLKGTTKVIRNDGQVETVRQQQATPRSTPNRNLAHLNSSPNIRPSSSSSTPPSLSSAQSYATPISTPNRNLAHLSGSPSDRPSSASSISNTQNYFSRNSNRQEASNVASRSDSSRWSNKSDTFSQRPSLKAHETASPLSRSASEPSSSFIRGQKIDALFKKPLFVVGAQASLASPKRAQTLTPTTSFKKEFTSPRAYSPQESEGPIVRTPDWLMSYPQTCEPRSRPLSPLNNEDIPLNSFASLSMGPTEGTNMIQAEANSPSVDDSSIYLSPSPRQIKKVVYQHSVDPRSPIQNKSQVPELAYGSCVSFSRPTPSPFKREVKLLEQFDANSTNGTPQSSVLFKSSFSSI